MYTPIVHFPFHHTDNRAQAKQKMRLNINDSQIVWPGKVHKKPEGIMIPTHLKVLTVEEKPFVYVRKLADEDAAGRCDDDEIPCPLFNATDGAGEFARLRLVNVTRGGGDDGDDEDVEWCDDVVCIEACTARSLSGGRVFIGDVASWS